MDRLMDEHATVATDGPQAEKSNGGGLMDAARHARMRQRKLARQKADDAKGDDKGTDEKPAAAAEDQGAADEPKGEETLAGGDEKGGEEEAKGTPDQALEVALKGKEGPLPHEEEMKKRFKGKPLNVRCFFGEEAKKACKMVGAKAFAVGNVLVFGDDAPDANVVAHELEHVVQQGDAPPPAGPLEMTEPGDEEEAEAEAKEKADPEKAGGEADPAKAPAADGGGGDGAKEQAAEGKDGDEKKEAEAKEGEGGEQEGPDPAEQKGKPAKLARYEAIQSPQGQLNVPLRTAPNTPGGMFVPVTTRIVRMQQQPAAAPGAPSWVQVRVTTGDDMGMTGWVLSTELGQQPETAEVNDADARRLFTELAGATLPGTDTPVPFHFPPDGCWGRAQIMANLLTEKGYSSEKVFAVSQKKPPGDNAAMPQPGLNVPTNFAPDAAQGQQPAVHWWYHVAPIIRVRSPEGRVAQMVIDPSMASGPIAIAAWTGMMAPEQFHEVPLAGVQQLIQQNNGTLYDSPTAVNHPMTFTADRNNVFPDDVGRVGSGGAGTTANTPANADAELQQNMPTLQQYAQLLAPLHELAASIREKLPGAPGTSNDIVQAIRGWASTPQHKMALAYFAHSPGGGAMSGQFPNLIAEMRSKLTPAAMAEIDALIAEGQALQTASSAGANAGGGVGGAVGPGGPTH